jgi:YARHG domain-containing protein
MRWIWVFAVVCACGSHDAPKQAEVTGRPTVSATGSGSAAGRGSAAAVAAVPVDAAIAAPVGSPKLKAARCGEPCLFLVDTPLDKLPGTFATECGGMKAPDLGYRDCKQLDYVRNCVYAAHGVVVKKKQWKGFANKPWYEAHPEVSAKTALSALELANVHELNERGKACKKGLAISGADYERVQAWFAALPGKSPMPKLVFRDDSWDESEHLAATDGKAFLAWLVDAEPRVKARFKAGELTTASYEDPAGDHSPNLLAAIHAADPKQLRIIRIDFDSGQHGTDEAPFTGGTLVKLVYDAHDQLVAVEGASYGYD